MKKLIIILAACSLWLAALPQAPGVNVWMPNYAETLEENGLLNGLIPCWELDETSGTTAYDSYSSYNGTITGTTLNQSGVTGTSFLFNGTSDHISVSSISDLLVDNPNTMSFSFWFKTTSTSAQSILGSFNTGSTTGLAININFYDSESAGRFRIYFRDDNNNFLYARTSQSHPQLYDGNWHNIIITRNATSIVFYLDGVYVADDTNVYGTMTDFSSFAYDFQIASANNRGSLYYPFDGNLDQVLIYDRVLTVDERSLINSIIPFSNFTTKIKQSIKTLWNSFYENIDEIQTLKIAS